MSVSCYLLTTWPWHWPSIDSVLVALHCWNRFGSFPHIFFLGTFRPQCGGFPANSIAVTNHLGYMLKRQASCSPICCPLNALAMAPKREMRLRPPLERKRVTAKPKRELHLEPKKKAKSSSSKILQKPDQKKDLLTPKGRYPTPFNLMDVDLWVPAGSLGAKKKRSRSVSSSTSATSDGNQGGRQLKKRRHRTSRCLVDELMEGKGLTLLEKSAIGPQSQKTYAAELEEFTIYAVPRGLDVRDSEGLDRLLVDYMNLLYLEGHQAYKADRLAASILHHYPQYGRHGDSKLPRLWRALKGFRKLCPGKSRLAYPLAIWAAVATRMRQLGHARMGLFVLMAVSTYGRPSEMLRLRVFSLVRPSPGITRNWTLLMSPEERPERSKTGDYDVSLSLDSPWMTSWSHTLFCLLKDNHPEAPLWDFDYNEYSKVFKKSLRTRPVIQDLPSTERVDTEVKEKSRKGASGRPWSQWFATRSRLA